MAKSDYGKRPNVGWSRKYERAWLRAHGEKCPECETTGYINTPGGLTVLCLTCNGTGYIEKDKE